ncbi:hypothetical protein WMY93_031093 [Mugilogobius chulae]|uniref:Uncharacterized protein n=1 Tax=Mugilogobius chulae TaxID=88201 RepID=A0AAW0MND6_9GOBI
MSPGARLLAFASATAFCLIAESAITGDHRQANVSYGYAPYAWICVNHCDPVSNWCRGRSAVGFALSVGSYNREKDICTHYCPGMIYAFWRPAETTFERGKTERCSVGAHVRRLDSTSCMTVPGGFKCSDRIVADTPLNKISVALHASQRNREYYFNDDPEGTCDPGPQCAAFKVLKLTLWASAESRKWPDPDQVLTLRNSPYACVLAYVGLGDLESVDTCYTQLGSSCFASQGSVFCVGESKAHRVGLTNWDPEASGPLAMCRVSRSSSSAKVRNPELGPSVSEIRHFLSTSSCDAVILSPDSLEYSARRLSIDLHAPTFHAVAEVSRLILRVPLRDCVFPPDTQEEAYAEFLDVAADKLSKLRVAMHAIGFFLDAEDWDEGGCNASKGLPLNQVASDLSKRLGAHNNVKLFLGLPRSRPVLRRLVLAPLLTLFDALVAPAGKADPEQFGRCQNLWALDSESVWSERDSGVASYLLLALKLGVPANKLIFTLSLTGSLKIARIDGAKLLEIIEQLSIADMETSSMLRCEENVSTKCCSGSGVAMWARDVPVNVTLTTTSLDTLKSYPELIAVAFGVNQFVLDPVDSDFKRGVRTDAPAILSITSSVHRLRDWKKQHQPAGIWGRSWGVDRTGGKGVPVRAVRSALFSVGADGALGTTTTGPYKDPASGSTNCLEPQYSVGLSNTLVCSGLVAVHGALGVFKEPHKELYGTSYDRIYLANVYSLESCTPGEPVKKAYLSRTPPQTAINVHTLSPTSDPSHYMVGILDTKKLVEYVPPVNQLCSAQSELDDTVRVGVARVDGQYVLDEPDLLEDRRVILKPVEALHFVSNFTPGVDYINLNVSCVASDASVLQPCIVAVCGGDTTCRGDYGRICDTAHAIIDDARRAGEMLSQGLQELAVQERKAAMYKLQDVAPLPGLDRGPRLSHSRRAKRWVFSMAALGVAVFVSGRVNALEEQMDYFKRSMVSVQGQMVEVSKKLNDNIALVDARIDEQEKQLRKNAETANSNFALLKDAIRRNAEAAMLDTNTKFSVAISYQMWYAQMQSVTHQLTQAAMQIKFLSKGIENCLRQIAYRRSGSCPSGLSVMRDHPGLSDFPTVGAALYKDKKLFIVHSVPGTVEAKAVRGVIPLPMLSAEGVPCWPDYSVWSVGDEYYEPSECHGKYCHVPVLHERFLRCLQDQKECKTVCARCHRGVCYDAGRFTWMQDSATVGIDSRPLRRLQRPRISEGPVTFVDLLKSARPSSPELQLLNLVNTSAALADVREDLYNISKSIEEFDRMYDQMSARRVSFGAWISGLVNGTVLWFWVVALTLWCSVLSMLIATSIVSPNRSTRARVKVGKRSKLV